MSRAPAPRPSALSRARRGVSRSAAFTWDALTDVGLQRHENEDAFTVVPERGLFVVCDGMGGHAKGAEASTTACEAIRTTIEETPGSRRAEPARALLAQAISAANERVHGLGQGIRRPGTTVAALLVAGASIVIAHVGDSRVYRLRDRGLEQLTIDHRVPFTRNVLTRALGTSLTVAPDITVSAVLPGDVFLLCSDGLEPLGREVIRGCLGLVPTRAVRELARLTLATGAPDNLTAIVVRFGGAA
jgi:serine/threonine protein phosphatase PrpC